MLILILFLVLSILNIMANRKNILDQNKEKLLDSVNAANQVYTNEELSTIVDELRERQDQLLGEIYPVGSIYKSTTDKNPKELFGGTWELLSADYDYISLGSQELYDHRSENGSGIQTELMIAYDYGMIDRLTSGRTTPPGYEVVYRFLVQLNGADRGTMKVYLNNTPIISVNSPWGKDIHRPLYASNFYKTTDLPLKEHVYDASHASSGLSLSTKTTFLNSPSTSIGDYRHLTVTAYYRSKNIMYTYRRLA